MIRVIIIADLVGDPKSECLEDVADLVGSMASPSGRFRLGDVTVYSDAETLRRDLSEGHERVECSLPTLGWRPKALDATCPKCGGETDKPFPRAVDPNPRRSCGACGWTS
jgi:hypothetical protein